MNLKEFVHEFSGKKNEEAIMPVLFAGHGSPMNAIEDNEFTQGWKKMATQLPAPKAILCVSAHWQTRGTKVTAMEQPETIHDFGGFPQALFDVQYPAPGNPDLAGQTIELLKAVHAEPDHEWGLDHGTWSVLKPMYPDAKIPVLQLSLDYSLSPQQHFALAALLKSLREKGVLIVGSGNIVHNLGMVRWQERGFDWADEFDSKVKELIEKGDFNPLVNYSSLGKPAQLSIPTNEHYLPMLYTLGLKNKTDEVKFFNEKTTMGSVSMRSMIIG